MPAKSTPTPAEPLTPGEQHRADRRRHSVRVGNIPAKLWADHSGVSWRVGLNGFEERVWWKDIKSIQVAENDGAVAIVLQITSGAHENFTARRASAAEVRGWFEGLAPSGVVTNRR